MCNEMYLKKGTHYHCGDYVGADGAVTGNLFSNIFVFKISQMMNNVRIVVRAVHKHKVIRK